jgi:hypothetical protein
VKFTPLVDFYSEDFASQYCKGLAYTVRNEKLARAAKQWEREGKIKLSDGPIDVNSEPVRLIVK